MKATTSQLYDLITSETFVNVEKKVKEIVERNSWNIPARNEYTFEEMLKDLPDCIDILKQSIDDGNFDTLPFNVRNAFLVPVRAINQHLHNVYTNHQQIPNIQDHLQTLKQNIVVYRLDFSVKKIPLYEEKVREYQNLIDQLSLLKENLNSIEDKQEVFDELVSTFQSELDNINTTAENILTTESNISKSLDNAGVMNSQISALLETIKENREKSTSLLSDSEESKRKVADIEKAIFNFHSKIEKKIKDYEASISNSEKKIEESVIQTQQIIYRNEALQAEIDDQLQKAVGASLFSTFEERKKELNGNLNNWLKGMGIILAVLVGLSAWIGYDIIGIDTNWVKVAIKIAISFPLIYGLIFLSSRYTKERRLVEEYAFKSSISLALSPYADLVKKVEDEATDSKYRDFLISSIENIFSEPTDKVFSGKRGDGKNLESKDNAKVVDDVLSLLEKAKNIVK